jgi:DNA-binding response OmpR family regulator
VSKKRLLVIDDDPDVRFSLTHMLEPAGYQVICAPTAEDGMDCIRKDHPDLILLDVMLASPSEGFHLAYELKRDEELKDIPIIMISAIGARMGMDYAKELGSDYLPVDRFLDKPLKSETVLGAVREVLQKRALPSP